MKEDSWVPIG